MTILTRHHRKSDRHRQGIREVTPAPAIKPTLSLRNIESEAKQGERRRRKAPARRQRGARAEAAATLRMKKRRSSKEVPEADQAEAEVAELEEAEARQDAQRVRETIKNLTNPARTEVTLRKDLAKEEEARISSSSTTKCTLGRRHEGKPARPQRMAWSAWPSPLKLPEVHTQLMERSEKIKNSYCPKQRARRMTRTRPRTSDASRNYALVASKRPASICCNP